LNKTEAVTIAEIRNNCIKVNTYNKNNNKHYNNKINAVTIIVISIATIIAKTAVKIRIKL
jgi:hypothetical protein